MIKIYKDIHSLKEKSKIEDLKTLSKEINNLEKKLQYFMQVIKEMQVKMKL